MQNFRDDAKPHIAITMREISIRVMNWPARSPDLNPLEHVYDNMGRRFNELLPSNLNERKQLVVEISLWDKTDQREIRNHASSLKSFALLVLFIHLSLSYECCPL
jgi:hypothetical protein